ncbi:MAG TPA: hypothetical protein VK698_18355 [Kofleriaceae bacterium]|nr:hypothetical protein [Kofleriaceae bacterium]
MPRRARRGSESDADGDELDGGGAVGLARDGRLVDDSGSSAGGAVVGTLRRDRLDDGEGSADDGGGALGLAPRGRRGSGGSACPDRGGAALTDDRPVGS